MAERPSTKNGEGVLALMRRLRDLPDKECLQGIIAYHAAPTLQGIKPANLVYPCREGRDFEAVLPAAGADLEREFGVRLAALGRRSRALPLLVYNPFRLAAAVFSPKAAALLDELGYGMRRDDLHRAVARLRDRFSCAAFPHEIGLFLGYPADDVREFMRDKGRGAICTGCWRAYGSRNEAEIEFARFRSAKLRAAELIAGGASLGELASGLKRCS